MRQQNYLYFKHATLLKFTMSFFGQSVLQTSETVPLYTTFKTDELFEMIKIGELSTFR